MSLSELGKYEEALPVLTKAFSQSADPVLRRMAGLHLQRTYTGLKRDRDAVDVALRLSSLYPDDPEVLYHSGRLFANFAYLQTMKLATVAPDSVWLHQAAGEANESQGLYDAAIREYRQVLTAAPRRPGIHFRIGRVLLQRSKGDASSAEMAGDAGEARKEFEAELALDPTNANAAYELAEMQRKMPESSSRPAHSSSRPCRTIQRSSRRSSDSDVRSLRSVGRLKVSLICRRLSRAIPRTRWPTIKPRKPTGHSGTPLTRRKSSPSSTGCAASRQSAPRYPRQSQKSPRRSWISSLRNEREMQDLRASRPPSPRIWRLCPLAPSRT